MRTSQLGERTDRNRGGTFHNHEAPSTIEKWHSPQPSGTVRNPIVAPSITKRYLPQPLGDLPPTLRPIPQLHFYGRNCRYRLVRLPPRKKKKVGVLHGADLS